MSDFEEVPRRPAILVILDGFGLNPSKRNNAVYLANTPRLDEYFERYPHTALEAAGHAVGLPAGQMGNSEVGHLTLGAGSILNQDLVRIDEAIRDGSFYRNEALNNAMDVARKKSCPLHLVGLVSDGGVHSHIRHLLALIDLAAKYGVKPHVHVITDGRDTHPKSALRYVRHLKEPLKKANGMIASVLGRFYAMDRDKRWDRTRAAWDVMVNGQGRFAEDPELAIETAYAQGESDEFIQPTFIRGGGRIRGGDPVIFFNYRNDRPRQLLELLGESVKGTPSFGVFQPASVTTMTEYCETYSSPVAFLPETPCITLAEAVSQARIRQFHCAETEKYAHVTFFFNGGREEPFPGETRMMVPSPAVKTYDEAPAMSAAGVADQVIQAIDSGRYGFIVVNFANGDMVGHTGNRKAILQAVEAMDHEVGKVLDAAVTAGFSAVVTADHGNCDEMVDPRTGDRHTQHTIYPVPLMVVDDMPLRLTNGAGLSSVAPTVLDLMGLAIPEGMNGHSLLIEEEELVA